MQPPEGYVERVSMLNDAPSPYGGAALGSIPPYKKRQAVHTSPDPAANYGRGDKMKQQPPHPHLPDQLRDPKLPVIHSRNGSAMQQRRTDAPLPQPENRADPL